MAVLADPIGDQASKFSDSVPGIVDDANAELADLQGWLDDNGIDVEVAEQGETALGDARARGSPRARASSSRSRARR